MNPSTCLKPKVGTLAVAVLLSASLAACAPVAITPAAAPAASQSSSEAAPSGPARTETIERLMKAQKVERLLDDMGGQIQQMIRAGAPDLRLAPDEQPLFDRHLARIATLTQESLDWPTMKAFMVETFRKNYTEEEVRGMLAFYESPVGRSMVDKQPAVLRESLAMSQQMMKSMLPKMVAMNKEFQQELAAHRRSKLPAK